MAGTQGEEVLEMARKRKRTTRRRKRK